MKAVIVEKHANGKIELWLTPETEIDRLFITEISGRACSGQTVKVFPEEGKLKVSVEER